MTGQEWFSSTDAVRVLVDMLELIVEPSDVEIESLVLVGER